MNSECIVILANDPEQSSDLNALEPTLGKRKVSYLGRAMFFDTLALCLSIPRTDIKVCYYPSGSKAGFEKMLDLFSREEKNKDIKSKVEQINMFPQNGQSVMDHISNAYKQVFDQNYNRVTMVGAYCIPLDPNLIKAGFMLLKENDIVVGPSFSGRYYLFGMSRFMPEVFDGVNWESKDFYIKLGQNIKTADAKVQELELSYEVYTPDELNQLISDINRWRSVGDLRTAYHTEKFLRVL